MSKSQVALHAENQALYPQNMAENRKAIVVPSCYGHMGPNLSHLLKVMEFRQGWLWSRMSSKVEPICQYKISCYFWCSPNKTSSFKAAWISQVSKSQTQSWGIFQKCSDSYCVDIKAVNSRLAFSSVWAQALELLVWVCIGSRHRNQGPFETSLAKHKAVSAFRYCEERFTRKAFFKSGTIIPCRNSRVMYCICFGILGHL